MTVHVLPDLTALSHEQLLTIIAQQQAALAAKRHQRGITFRVNDQPVTDKKTGVTKPGAKGVSVLGLGQWPMTAYASQWLRLLEVADELRAFIEANRSRLAWKD